MYVKNPFLMDSSFGASVHLHSNQFHFAVCNAAKHYITRLKSLYYQAKKFLLLDYLTVIVSSKVEDVTIENHKGLKNTKL